MLLKSVKYHNFRPFKGDQEIILTNDNPDENVTIILGDNTFGKSTFVLSFIWCLYGESRFTRAKDILNKKIEASLPPDEHTIETAFVEVVFEDDGKLYTVRRTQKFTKNTRGKVSGSDAEIKITYVCENGETKSVGGTKTEIDRVIKSILPMDLSSFFFFEGEKNNEINRKELGKSVRTLLGLEAYEKMRTHLYGSQTQAVPYANSVMGDYLKRQNDESGMLAQEAFEKMQRAEQEGAAADERVAQLNKEISGYENLIEQLNEKLRQAEPSKVLQRRRDKIAAEHKVTEEKLASKNKAFFRIFSDGVLPVFMVPLVKPTQDTLKKMEVDDKGIKGIEAAAIKELLKRGECLCGCQLSEGSASYRNVARYIDFVPPRSLGTLVRDMQESLNEVGERASNFAESFEETYKDIVELRLKIDALDKEDSAILEEIREIGVVDTEEIENNQVVYKRRISELREERDSQIEIRQAKSAEAARQKKIFDTNKSKSDAAKEIHLYYRYAEAIYNWVNDNYAAKEDTLRKRLNSYITEIFNNMYSGKRDVVIDEKYNINMTVNGTVVDDTGGLRVIQYFAYVGGLVKLAREIMTERGAGDISAETTLGELYPLVLDAAFSHADEKHTKNIARELANTSGQLIFALMRKDWNYAKDGLIGKVNRIYELNKIDETEVQIRVVK